MCLLLGFCGGHQYYLRNYNRAIFYGWFFWSGIPFIVSLIDFIILSFLNDTLFQKKYNTYIYGTGSKEGLQRYLESITFSFLLLFS